MLTVPLHYFLCLNPLPPAEARGDIDRPSKDWDGFAVSLLVLMDNSRRIGGFSIHLSPVSELLGGRDRHPGFSIVNIGEWRPIRMPDLEGGRLLSISDVFLHKQVQSFL